MIAEATTIIIDVSGNLKAFLHICIFLAAAAVTAYVLRRKT